MARPLRIQVAGGWYYVSARGRHRDRIFLDLQDAMDFYGRLAELPERFGVEVHAFVMMPDHYHLLLRTPHGGLSRAVQWLNTGYSIGWNHRHRRSGSVFQGRFKTLLIQDAARALAVSLYLHFNPVAVEALGAPRRRRAGAPVPPLPGDPASRERRLQPLRGWRWSSYRAYAGLEAAPPWLDTEALLAEAGGTPVRYAALAESQLGSLGSALWGGLQRGGVLGTPEFARQALAQRPARRAGRADWPGRTPWSAVVAWVEKRRGAAWAELCGRRGDWARDLAWWAAKRWSGLTFKELGRLSGGAGYATVAKALERFPVRCEKEPDLRIARDELTAYCRRP